MKKRVITIKLTPFAAHELEWLCEKIGWNKTEAISQAIIYASGFLKEYLKKEGYEESERQEGLDKAISS